MTEELVHEAQPSLPPELVAEFELLSNDIHRIQVFWNQYRGLFGHADSINLLNATAPGFFAIIEQVLLESVIVGIMRLLDKPRTSGQSNLTLEHVIETLKSSDATLAGELRDELDRLRDDCASLKQMRHKVYAHRDLQTAILDARLSTKKSTIERAILRMYRLVGRIGRVSLAPCMDPPGSYGSLLRVLEAKTP